MLYYYQKKKCEKNQKVSFDSCLTKLQNSEVVAVNWRDHKVSCPIIDICEFRTSWKRQKIFKNRNKDC